MVDRSAGRTTHITAPMKFFLSLLIAMLTLLAGCFPWPNGEYEFQLGDAVKVVNTGTVGLQVRSAPAGTVTAVVPENWVFQISNATPKSATLNGVSYLWWYVTDAQYESSPTSGWVAERYLTKVFPNNLSPSTVPAYFTASTGQIDSVIVQAHHEVDAGSKWYDYSTGNYLCLGFVRDVYGGQAMGWPSAHAAMVALQGQGIFHYATDSWNPPKGALVFFTSTSEYDHVGLSIGSRQVAHVEGDRKAHVRDLEYVVQLSYIDAYAGWAYPPEEWCQVPPLSEIAFASSRDGNAEIYVMNADGTNQRRLTNDPADDFSPFWSPDGTRFAFESERDGKREIYVMNADGSDRRRLTNPPAEDGYPVWSPDGRKIAFWSKRDGNNEIYVMNADGTNQRRLTNDPALDSSPAWSPDGTRIAFRSARDGNEEIYVMNADGTNQGRLTNHPAADRYPAWSPDGRKIAFTSARDGNEEIYVMNADGRNQRNLTNHPELLDWFSVWSPDGTKIAFMSERDGSSAIYVMNADGTNRHRLTNHPAWNWFPVWSPDGTRIAFVSKRDGNMETYVMNADGSDQRNLTNHPAWNWIPAWSPVLP